MRLRHMGIGPAGGTGSAEGVSHGAMRVRSETRRKEYYRAILIIRARTIAYVSTPFYCWSGRVTARYLSLLSVELIDAIDLAQQRRPPNRSTRP